MTKLAETLGLNEFQTEIIATVRQFVEKEVIPINLEARFNIFYFL